MALPIVSQSFTTFASGRNINGWTVEFNSVDLIGTYWRAAHGYQSMQLSAQGAGAIYQDLPTTAGHYYALSFAMAGNPDGGPAVKQMEVRWGDSSLSTLSFNSAGQSDSAMGWQYQTFVVQAVNTVTRLTFIGLTAEVMGQHLMMLPSLRQPRRRAVGRCASSPLYPTGGAGLPLGVPVRVAWQPFPHATSYLFHVWMVKQDGSKTITPATPLTLSTLVYNKTIYTWNTRGFLPGTYQYSLLPLDSHGNALFPWSPSVEIHIYAG